MWICPCCGRIGLRANADGRLRKHLTDTYWQAPCPYSRTEAEIVALGETPETLIDAARRAKGQYADRSRIEQAWRESISKPSPAHASKVRR